MYLFREMPPFRFDFLWLVILGIRRTRKCHFQRAHCLCIHKIRIKIEFARLNINSSFYCILHPTLAGDGAGSQGEAPRSVDYFELITTKA